MCKDMEEQDESGELWVGRQGGNLVRQEATS